MGACNSSRRTDRDTSAGQVIENGSPRWTAADAWRLPALPQVTIGEANGAPEYALSNVVGAVRLSNGHIVLANRGTNDLRYFDSSGRYVRTVGREGNGPGEFRWIDAIANAGDTVLVWDAFARRLSRFESTGNFASSTSLALLVLAFPVLIGFLGDGSMLLRRQGGADDNARHEGEYVDSVTYLRFSGRTGAPVGMLGPYFGGELFRAVAGRNHMSGHVIFGKRGLVATTSTGIYTVETDRFAATFHTPAGTPVRKVLHPHTPVRATAADIATQREAQAQGDEEVTRLSLQLTAAQRRLRETLPHRAILPAITELRVDRQDNLWIRAYAPPGAPSAAWSVFDAEGDWLGVVAIPAELQVLEIGDDWILARHVDPLEGVERVVLYALHKPH